MIKLEIALILAGFIGVALGILIFLLWRRLGRFGLQNWKSKTSLALIGGLLLFLVGTVALEKNRGPIMKSIRYEIPRPEGAPETDREPVRRQMRITQKSNAGFDLLSSPIYKRELILGLTTLIALFVFTHENVRNRFARPELAGLKVRTQKIPNGINTESVLDNLKAVLAEEKLYQDPELNLDTLAQKLELSKYHLSQIINENLGKNFHELINGYRVREAIELLDQKPENGKNLLSIGYEVGFNSKASFYRVFKKVTGTTPAAYQKSVKQC